MQFGKDNYYNTGGNCMVMYIDVENGGEIKQLAVTDELVASLGGRVEEGFEGEEIWWTDEYENLVQFVGEENATQLQDTFMKYDDDAMWFKK